MARPLPLFVGVALEIVSKNGNRIPINELELRMHQQGFGVTHCLRAYDLLESHGWVFRAGGHLVLTPEGIDAAKAGIRRGRRPIAQRKYARMPRGLFG